MPHSTESSCFTGRHRFSGPTRTWVLGTLSTVTCTGASGIGIGDAGGRRHRPRHLVPGARAGRVRRDRHDAARRRPTCPPTSRALAGTDEARGVETVAVRTVDRRSGRQAPADAYDVYLRLHLLSHRLVAAARPEPRRRLRPAHQRGVDQLRPVRGRRLRAASARGCAPRARSPSTASTSSRGWSTTCVPAGVRIADADRVRLGAHLASGTTVMHEGFVNFNAGTLGTSMVEGRISAGVVVGDGSDVGGGASIMGTLSGGGKRGHLRSASAACSAPTPASASRSATTASSRPACTSPPAPRSPAPTAPSSRPRNSAESPTSCCRRNSVTGAVEVVPNKGTGVELNAALHAND